MSVKRYFRVSATGVLLMGLLAATHAPRACVADKPESRSIALSVSAPDLGKARLAVVDPQGWKVVHRAKAEAEQTLQVLEGHEIWVGAPGCDLWRERVGSQVRVASVLRGTVDQAVLRLKSGGRQAAGCRGAVHVLQSPKPSWLGPDEDPPFWFSYELELKEETPVPTPAGFLNRVMLKSQEAMLAPAMHDLKAGEKPDVAVLRPEALALDGLAVSTAAGAELDAVHLAFDDHPPEAVAVADAIRWWMARPKWGLRATERGWEVVGLPPHRCHVFLRVGESRVHCESRSPGNVGVQDPAPWRAERPPTVGGRPCPEGTVVMPGRLDFRTAVLVSQSPAMEGYRAVVRDANAPLTLPRSLSGRFTVLLPDHSIAYGSWPQDTKALFVESGLLSVHLKESGPYTIDLYSDWEGGGLDARPLSSEFRRRWTGQETAVYSGLPQGTYRLTVRRLGAQEADERRVLDRIIHVMGSVQIDVPPSDAGGN